MSMVSTDFPVTNEVKNEQYQISYQTQNLLSDYGFVLCPRNGCTAVLKRECLHEHENLVHNDERGICNYCEKTILIRDWPTHIENCQTTHKGTRCSVEGCDAIMKKNHSLEHHMITAHSISVPCTYDNCNAKVQAAKLLAHVREVHMDQIVRCNNCNREFTNLAMADHSKICDLYKVDDLFVCTVRGCDLKFPTKAQRNVHVYHKHEPPMECPATGCWSVIKRRSLMAHFKSTHKEESSKCRYCSKEIEILRFVKHLKICRPIKTN